MFEWNDDYLVGVNAIDAQHKQLFRLAQRFHDAVVANRGKALIGETLDALVRYTEGHFNVEERLMASLSYPEYAEHSQQHRALCQKLRDFQDRFDHGETAMTIQLLQFLSRWLVGHTTSTDRRLAAFYRASHEESEELIESPS